MQQKLRVLVTGACGFIGSHACSRWAAEHEVLGIDNLSRRGSEANLAWLQSQRRFCFQRLDVRDTAAIKTAVREWRPDLVVHQAAQVAVTTSMADPRNDFEVNALGTFNVLEAVRQHAPEAIFLYASTNKVYGGMDHCPVALVGKRYAYVDLDDGAGENQPLDFHSPYGCSKGTGDQYTVDYARIYGLRTVVFRQSCIYGTRQFGIEDQGWVAWFAIRAAQNKPVTIYGDGRQVRDVLWIDDLLNAYDAAIANIERVKGRAFNVGGGPGNTLSLLELLGLLENLTGKPVQREFSDWRPGDQKVFIADTRLAQRELEWRAKVTPADGVARLLHWVRENISLFE